MEEVKKELITMCEKEISKGDIFVGFYKEQEAKSDKEVAGKIALKRMQIEDSIRFNQELREYIKAL